MTNEQMTSMINTIMTDIAEKIRRQFDACPAEMNATEALNKVLAANIGDSATTRILRVARQYAIPNINNEEGIRAYVKAVAMPADKLKSLSVKLELENTIDNRMLIAKLDGEQVNMYCAQLDVEAYAAREDGEEAGDDDQMDIEDIGEDDEPVAE